MVDCEPSKGKNNHYHWYDMQRRYFLQTAKNANYSQEKAEQILDEMLKNTEVVLRLSQKFFQKIFQAVYLNQFLTEC